MNRSVRRPDKTNPEQPDAGLNICRKWSEHNPDLFLWLIFTLIWNGTLWFVALPMIRQFNDSFFNNFVLIFVFVGIGLAYHSLANFINQTTLTLTAEKLIVRHSPLPWRGDKDLQVADIKRLYTEQHRACRQCTVTYEVRVVTRQGNRETVFSRLYQRADASSIKEEIENFLNIEGGDAHAFPTLHG